MQSSLVFVTDKKKFVKPIISTISISELESTVAASARSGGGCEELFMR